MRLAIRYRGDPELPLIGSMETDARGRIFFEFDPDWRAGGIDLSPIHLPVSTTGSLTNGDAAFGPLFGLFDDSLPDWWGQRVMRRHFEKLNIPWAEVGPLEKLACQGAFSIGALAYEPDLSPDSFRGTLATEVALLVDSARHLVRGDSGDIIPAMIRGGLSPGGAQPKALVAFNGDFSEVLAGGAAVPREFSHWLLKFQLDPEDDLCRQEHAIALMAGAAGIRVPETRLFMTSDGAAHFMSRRFDAGESGPVHVHSYAGLTHTPVRELIDYADLMDLTRELSARETEIEEMFRRAVFNIAIANEDDHSRNHSFLMDQGGQWTLSPAYDMTRTGYALGSGFRAAGVMGKFSRIDRRDLGKLGRSQSLRNIDDQINRVLTALDEWPHYAAEAGLSDTNTALLRNEFPASRW